MSKQSLTQIIDKGFEIYNQPQEHLAEKLQIPKLDLDSARVPVSQLFKKTALVKIKAAESLRRFVNLTSFKSV